MVPVPGRSSTKDLQMVIPTQFFTPQNCHKEILTELLPHYSPPISFNSKETMGGEGGDLNFIKYLNPYIVGMQKACVLATLKILWI